MEQTQHILMTGATGFIGTRLRERLLMEGHFLTVVTRAPGRFRSETAKNQRFISWDSPDFAETLGEQDLVINLAGESVAGSRWNDQVKKSIYDSRVLRTRQLVMAMASQTKRPSCFISASAVGIYGDRGDTLLTEESAAGTDFLSKVCVDWEAEAAKASDLGIRTAMPRIGIVLGPNGGMLEKLLPVFKLFAGGPVGSGGQYLPWIHLEDVCDGILHPFEHPEFTGPYNLCAPEPVTMSEFARVLGEVLRRPSMMKVPSWALKLALGEAADPVLGSLRVSPAKLVEAGFTFRFETLEAALADLV
jgi:uncharacterized protein (TIGR01777 family)